MEDIRLKLSPPWVTYVNELIALFGEDPEINIKYDNYETKVKLYVNNQEKAEALCALLPMTKYFGNVALYIDIIPANGDKVYIGSCRDIKTIYETAFKGNPVFSFVYKVEGIFANSLIYVIFKNKVVQFFNDNLNDVYGNVSTLYQEIAKDVIIKDENEFKNVFYCTDIEGKLKKPLGEWP